MVSVPVTARSCSTTDAVCDPPVTTGVTVPPQQQGYPGGFAIGLPPAPFTSFIRLTAPGYADFDYYIKGPMNENVVATQPFSMVSLTSFGEFVAGLRVDPMRASQLGVLALLVFDCNSDPAVDVELKLTTGADSPEVDVVPFAIQDRIPVADRRTDVSGLAGFVNVPLGNVTVEALVDGRSFGSTSFPVLPGRLTSGTLRTNYVKGY